MATWSDGTGVWTSPFGVDTHLVECVDGGNGGEGAGGGNPRWEIDYERNAHRKTTELLIEKNQQKQQLEIALGVLGRSYDVAKVELRCCLEEMTRLVRRECALDVVLTELCIPLVRDLFASTNSAKEHAACQAALAAYEELTHAPEPSQPAPDPVDVGFPQPRHVSDCQQERGEGMGGGQLPGPAGRTQDRAAPDREIADANHAVAAYFHGIPTSSGYKTAYLEWDRDGPWPTGEAPVDRVVFDKRHKVGTKQECLDCASALAAELRARKQCVLWRVDPHMDRQDNFIAGKTEWSFYCRYAAVPEDLFKKINSMDFSMLRE